MKWRTVNRGEGHEGVPGPDYCTANRNSTTSLKNNGLVTEVLKEKRLKGKKVEGLGNDDSIVGAGK